MLDSWLQEMIDHTFHWIAALLAEWIVNRLFRGGDQEEE